MKKVTFTKPLKSALLVLVAAFSTAALAVGPGPQWTWAAGAQTNNGAIVLKSTNGSTTYSGTQNPTGAVAKVNQTAATQPPTVIVQATASLPIKAVGDACSQTTSGTSPNQSADEGTAITADRSLILSCQSGTWGKSAGGGIFDPAPGTTLTCSMGGGSAFSTAYARNQNGSLQTRISGYDYFSNCDSGWVNGKSAACSTSVNWLTATTTLTGLSGAQGLHGNPAGYSCTANWP